MHSRILRPENIGLRQARRSSVKGASVVSTRTSPCPCSRPSHSPSSRSLLTLPLTYPLHLLSRVTILPSTTLSTKTFGLLKVVPKLNVPPYVSGSLTVTAPADVCASRRRVEQSGVCGNWRFSVPCTVLAVTLNLPPRPLWIPAAEVERERWASIGLE